LQLKVIKTAFVICVASAQLSNAAGLERRNIETDFLFADGMVVDLGVGSVSPSFTASQGGAFAFEAGKNIAPRFSVITGNFKVAIDDNLDLGFWHTNSGNGVHVDYGTVTGPGMTGALNSTFTAVTNSAQIKADLSIPTTMIAARYSINENLSILAGAKYVNVSGGQLMLPSELGVADPAALGVGDAFIDTTSVWNLGSKDGTGTVFGVAYEIPEIALRVSLVAEGDIALSIPTTTGGGVAANGNSTASIGDATTLSFQTGIAENTLLFGSVRQSNWADNQINVPTSAGPAQVSSFKDGENFTIGIGRKFSDKLSGSISYYFSDGDGNGASELSPFGETKTVSLGTKYSLNEGTDVSFGLSQSERGDATTGKFAAKLTGSSVTSIGVKLTHRY
jgi:long-subunit fatty acid transport protein